MIKEKTLSVSAIKEGTVIDHIVAGQALKIIRLLRLAADARRVTVGLNLKSRSLGLKDLIKVENFFLDLDQAHHIAVFSPTAMVNVIENYEVVRKFAVEMPKTILGVLRCPNVRCTTNGEKVPTYFFVEPSGHQIHLHCRFCEKLFSRDQLQD